MSDPQMRQRFQWYPYEALRDFVEALRARRDNANLTALRRYFEGRMTQHPSEERMLQTLVQMTTR
jgi:hypothetical protein